MSALERTSQFPPGNYIEEIEIEKLFGDFSYRLKPADKDRDPRIAILYGDNGVGKTTILKIVWHMLSSAMDAGHRSSLSELPFKHARVRFTDGRCVEVEREKNIVGDYTWSFLSSTGNRISVGLSADERSVIQLSRMPAASRAAYRKIVENLSAIFKSVDYLDDQRTARSGGHVVSGRDFDPDWEGHGDAARMGDPVVRAFSELASSLRREAFLRANRGQKKNEAIYADLLNRLARGTDPQENTTNFDDLVEALAETHLKSERYAQYGLISTLEHEKLTAAVGAIASSENRALIRPILAPYIESVTERLNALESLHEIIDSWMRNMTSFLAPKKLKFKVAEDIWIMSRKNARLSPVVLSSGERHLLLLMTKVLTQRASEPLVIIDEPELSLNVKWQRSLLGALVSSFGGGAGQLLVASHSIEIFSKYRGSVWKVAERGEGGKGGQ